MKNKKFRFHHGGSFSNAYLESDIKYVLNKSKSIIFNKEKFEKNSSYMGIQKNNVNKKYIDKVIPLVGGEMDIYFSVGSKKIDANSTKKHWYAKEEGKDNYNFWFMLKAIFNGRESFNRVIIDSSTCKCLVCGKIEERYYDYERNILTVDWLERYEYLCDEHLSEVFKIRNEVNDIDLALLKLVYKYN